MLSPVKYIGLIRNNAMQIALDEDFQFGKFTFLLLVFYCIFCLISAFPILVIKQNGMLFFDIFNLLNNPFVLFYYFFFFVFL